MKIDRVEKDSSLLQRLVAKECEHRHILMKPHKESGLDQLKDEETKGLSFKEIMEAMDEVLPDKACACKSFM